MLRNTNGIPFETGVFMCSIHHFIKVFKVFIKLGSEQSIVQSPAINGFGDSSSWEKRNQERESQGKGKTQQLVFYNKQRLRPAYLT